MLENLLGAAEPIAPETIEVKTAIRFRLTSTGLTADTNTLLLIVVRPGWVVPKQRYAGVDMH